MNVDLKPMTVEEAHKFVSETLLKATYYCEITEEAAIARIEFFWDCLVQSIIKNYEDWNGLEIKDFRYVELKAIELKRTLIKQKFAQAKKDNVTIDGVQVQSVNLETKTEFVYQMGQDAKPRNKYKTLTIEWIEPCDSNSVHTVALPPPPPPYHNIGEEQKLNTGKGEDSYKFQIPPSTFSSIQQIQSALKKDDYSYLNKLLKKAFAPWIGGYQPISKEDQETATPPKSR